MTNKRYILRSTSHSLKDSEEKLLSDQGLIVLLESANYVKRKNTDRIRYSPLKQYCNEKLAYLTRNPEADLEVSLKTILSSLKANQNQPKDFWYAIRSAEKKATLFQMLKRLKNSLQRKIYPIYWMKSLSLIK